MNSKSFMTSNMFFCVSCIKPEYTWFAYVTLQYWTGFRLQWVVVFPKLSIKINELILLLLFSITTLNELGFGNGKSISDWLVTSGYRMLLHVFITANNIITIIIAFYQFCHLTDTLYASRATSLPGAINTTKGNGHRREQFLVHFT